jgi:hypothetical protein
MAVILSGVVPNLSFAAVLYTYTGNPFTAVVDSPLIPGTHTTGMHVQASLLFDAPLAPNMPRGKVAPLAATFSDGRNTLDSRSLNDPAASSWFELGTDSLGNIVDWILSMSDDMATPPATCTFVGCVSPEFVMISTSFFTTLSAHSDQGSLGSEVQVLSAPPLLGFSLLLDIGNSSNSPGSWSVSTVPEPSTVPLYIVGLAVLAFSRRAPSLSR